MNIENFNKEDLEQQLKTVKKEMLKIFEEYAMAKVRYDSLKDYEQKLLNALEN